MRSIGQSFINAGYSASDVNAAIRTIFPYLVASGAVSSSSSPSHSSIPVKPVSPSSLPVKSSSPSVPVSSNKPSPVVSRSYPSSRGVVPSSGLPLRAALPRSPVSRPLPKVDLSSSKPGVGKKFYIIAGVVLVLTIIATLVAGFFFGGVS